MQDKPVVGLYLDTRSASKKNEGKFPVKVRITFEIRSKQKSSWKAEYVHTNHYLTREEYEPLEKGKAKGRLKDAQDKIFATRAKVAAIIDSNRFITIPQFWALYNGTQKSTTKSTAVRDLFQEVIDHKRVINKPGTADYYNDAMGSLLAYGGQDLDLIEIDKQWLEGYESSTLLTGNRTQSKKPITKELSINTIGAYLRALRSVFNKAIKEGKISPDRYPFGKKEYVIKRKRVKKKPIPLQFLKDIKYLQPETEAYAEAIDFTLFSFYCNGMNFADMAYLRNEDFQDNAFSFVRRKSKDTVQEQKAITVWINNDIRAILNRRRKLGSYYIFGIITPDTTVKEQDDKVKQWRKTTNKWLKRLALKLGYSGDVNTQRLRHTYTTALINAKVPITQVKDALGHTIVTTTQEYAEDLNIDTARELSQITNL
jgi:integrase/recombinase XerD